MAQTRYVWLDTPGVFGPAKRTQVGPYAVLICPTGDEDGEGRPRYSLMLDRRQAGYIYGTGWDGVLAVAEQVLRRYEPTAATIAALNGEGE